MTTGDGTRDGENEAFVVDGYLETLLSRRPTDAVEVAPELRASAAILMAGLPRFHPSFRFEETLAERLAVAGAALSEPVGEVIPFPHPVPMAAVVEARPGAETHPGARRPTVIGGVLTSAAISLAAGAYVAWRRSRSPVHPMARAIRAAARRKTA